MSLEVMRKTPHTRLRKSAFKLHYGRKPNTEISNLLKLDMLENQQKIPFQPNQTPYRVLFQWSRRCVGPATSEAKEKHQKS